MEENNVKDDFSMQNCEKWDSLGHLILISNIENKFNITIEPDMIIKLKSIKAIEEFLQKNIN